MEFLKAINELTDDELASLKPWEVLLCEVLTYGSGNQLSERDHAAIEHAKELMKPIYATKESGQPTDESQEFYAWCAKYYDHIFPSLGHALPIPKS